VPRQVQKEFKFFRSQADFPFLYADASRLQVNAEITDCDQIWCRIFCSGGAAECCSRAREQFVHTEGFCHIIVRTGVECFYLIWSSPFTDKTMIGI